MGRKEIPDFEFYQNDENKKKMQKVHLFRKTKGIKKLKSNEENKHCCTYFPYSMNMVAKLRKAS